jgi:hypothetical protein
MNPNLSELVWCGGELAYGWRVYRDNARVYAMYTGNDADRQGVRTWYAYSATTLPLGASHHARVALVALS